MNRKLGRPRLNCLALAVAVLSLGCDASNGESESTIRLEDPLYVDTDALWEDAQIPVCWDDTDSANATAREWVRNQIEKTWSFVANVQFTGWETCDSSWVWTPGIAIYVSDETPHSNWLGESMWGIEINRAMLTLNFTYENWSPNCKSKKEACTRAIAAHEFGHLLGFAHEQNRGDTPASCTEEEQGSDGNAVFGEWDLNSVMNYCSPSWNNGGQLSATDIEGAQYFYGMGPRYVAAISAAAGAI